MRSDRRTLLLGVACLIVLALAIAIGSGLGSSAEDGGSVDAAVDGLTGTVVSVADGDTFHVDLPTGEETVRVIGIDTPEIAHEERPAACYGPEAATWVRQRLDGRRVRLVRGAEPVDRFGRSLARVQVLEGPLAGRDLSRSVAEQGLARPLSIEPNTDDAPAIAELVRRARAARLGLWGACGFAAAFPGRG
jgi:micrococcal nuclease